MTICIAPLVAGHFRCCPQFHIVTSNILMLSFCVLDYREGSSAPFKSDTQSSQVPGK